MLPGFEEEVSCSITREMAIDDRFAELNLRTCVVLGGRGFIGRSLVLRLLKFEKWIVRVADSAQSLQLGPSEDDSLLSLALSSGRASYFHVDVRDKSQIAKVVEGSSVVFYMDYTDLLMEDFHLCYTVIVQGAKNVISACRDCKVRRLIYNSSADVVFDGSCDIINGDESLTYPCKFEDTLADLKAQAEALVLFANDIDGLLTCALRPSNVFGPDDKQLFSLLLNLVKSGWTRFNIGSGENKSDFTYAENVAHAHICAEKALDFQMVSVAGKAFFITNLEPMKFWDFMSLILEGLGYQRPSIKIPTWMVRYFLVSVKWMHKKLHLSSYKNSVLAHYLQLASCTITFNCSAAQNQLGYSPLVTLEDGVMLSISPFSHLGKDSSLPDFNEQSKVDKLLGSGRVAYILLWRDERKSFICFLALVILFYCFFLSTRSFISSATKLLLLITFGLYGYGIMNSYKFGFVVQKLSVSRFEVSESAIKATIMRLAHLWNGVIINLGSLARGEDWNIFMKAVASLFFLKLVSTQSLTVVIGVALVFAFTAFFIYEQYEAGIDVLAKFLFYGTKKSISSLMRNLSDSMSSFLHKSSV